MFPWIITGLVLFLLALLVTKPFLDWMERKQIRRGIEDFKLRREVLEAKFFDIAASIGKPRGLRWKECDWQEQVFFARDMQTQLLTAFVSVEIHFEAIEGGDMEDVPAVDDVRDASAVFHYQSGTWGTGGKALFNMDPASAVTRLVGQYEPVE